MPNKVSWYKKIIGEHQVRSSTKFITFYIKKLKLKCSLTNVIMLFFLYFYWRMKWLSLFCNLIYLVFLKQQYDKKVKKQLRQMLVWLQKINKCPSTESLVVWTHSEALKCTYMQLRKKKCASINNVPYGLLNHSTQNHEQYNEKEPVLLIRHTLPIL